MSTMHIQLKALDLIFDEKFIYSKEKDAFVFNSEHKNGAPTVESIEEFKKQLTDLIREQGTFFEETEI
jgi:hypothetical protein